MLRSNFVRGFLLSLAVSGALAACSGAAAEPAQQTFTGGPRLSFDKRAWDFGEVPLGKPLEVVFRLQNVGDRPLVIEKALTRVVEGCCPPQPEMKARNLPPGKSSTIALQFTMQGKDMAVPHTFEVVVLSNDPEEPEARLTVKAVFLSK